MEWSEDLLSLFDDPLLANIRPFPPRITSDDRLVESFLEILDWAVTNEREPKEDSVDFTEKRYYRRLLSIRNDEEQSAFLKEYDTVNLLND